MLSYKSLIKKNKKVKIGNMGNDGKLLKEFSLERNLSSAPING